MAALIWISTMARKGHWRIPGGDLGRGCSESEFPDTGVERVARRLSSLMKTSRKNCRFFHLPDIRISISLLLPSGVSPKLPSSDFSLARFPHPAA